MIKNILLLFILTISAPAAFSQTAVTDSIKTGPGYANDVFYSLKNGEIKTVPNNEWQLAFSIGTYNVAVRANTNTGSSGDGSVTVYECPEQDVSKWATLNTAGYGNWDQLDNSDEDWEAGAFNIHAGENGAFDYGWGMYDMSSHVVEGNRLYLVEVKTGSTTLVKKLWIVDKTLGTWNVKYANIDGTDEKTVAISSAAYNGKNFVYLSLVTGEVIDREPESAGWDLMLTRYRGMQPQEVYYPVTGILTNTGVSTAEVRGVDVTLSSLSDTLVNGTSANISVIGSDWKQFDGTAYAVVDDLSYFVKAKDGAFWKLVFTEFTSSTGHVAFTKTKLTNATGIQTTDHAIRNVAVYPNPSNDRVHILFDVDQGHSILTITNLTGKTLLQYPVSGNGFHDEALDISNFPKGIYLLNIANGSSNAVQKIAVN